MLIGICDDEKKFQEETHNLCEQYFNEKPEEHSYVFFSNGDEVISYCQDENTQKIDLLFLDIEMGETSGMDTKKYAEDEPKIWRLVFVSSHSEFVFDAFGTKTLDFIQKPAPYEKIAKAINITRKELKKNIMISFKDTQNSIINILIDNIIFFEANGNYTQVNTNETLLNGKKSFLITKQIGEIDELVKGTPIIRVHKSYLINMDYIINFSTEATLKTIQDKIPIGRKYKEVSKKKYYNYCEERVRGRL